MKKIEPIGLFKCANKDAKLKVISVKIIPQMNISLRLSTF